MLAGCAQNGVADPGDTGGVTDSPISALIVGGKSGEKSLLLATGASEQLTARAVSLDGSTVNSAPAPTWTVRDSTIARVGTGGLVTAAAPGSTYVVGAIIVESSVLRDSVLVTVVVPN
jgi:hypothetical protein